MPIPRSDAYAFPVELPAALCGAAESERGTQRRIEKNSIPANPALVALAGYGAAGPRATARCQRSASISEERPPAPPSAGAFLQLRRKPRAAFPARRARHRETLRTETLEPNSRSLRIRAQERPGPHGKPGARARGKRSSRRSSVPTQNHSPDNETNDVSRPCLFLPFACPSPHWGLSLSIALFLRE